MTGIALIAEERSRSRDVEGYDEAHDDKHEKAQITCGAIAYATVAMNQCVLVNRLDTRLIRQLYWPFDIPSWKPDANPIRNLVKAGAMIAAEIDRLQRLEAAKT